MAFFKKIPALLLIMASVTAGAQEFLMPLRENIVIRDRAAAKNNVVQKPTILTLPFFEDFTDDDPYPNTERWADRYVYINNTMGRQPVSRGVATFDALNEKGAVYYDNIDAYTRISADTLTSRAIDLSGHVPADSVYLSFFYQPKGYGFFPKPSDSLSLYLLKSNGVWEKVWSQSSDTTQQPFRQVMIPVTDTGYFNSNFKMRWINLATIGISNSHWNLDYIRLDEGRSWSDTTIRDIAFTRDPLPILNDFSAMPFRHFKTNPASFLAGNLTATLQNIGTASQNVTSGYTATVQATGSQLGTGSTANTAAAHTQTDISFPMYNAGSYTPADPNGRIVYEHRFYCSSTYPGEPKENDTIVYRQVFDNYFAYDDGTAEQAYFLNLLPAAPGYTAVEYALYRPDTLRGIAVRFATTLPSGSLKQFAIGVYRDIAVNGGSDQLLYQESFLYPEYEDTINKFSVYSFSQPLVMEPGTFYISIIQAAGSSDSLQIALDANRSGANHRYFKVEHTWEPSLLNGALLLRPLLGAPLPVGISQAHLPELAWDMYPNPAGRALHVRIPDLKGTGATYSITDVQGRTLLSGPASRNTDIDLRSLSPGIYFVRIRSTEGYGRPAKLLKL